MSNAVEWTFTDKFNREFDDEASSALESLYEARVFAQRLADRYDCVVRFYSQETPEETEEIGPNNAGNA